ncbi:complement C1q-like protein 2 [Epinephelus moara]|uniref:complement C1q-like protein 2 n=1 Tax=Epinephelus moara TaxID=300413 RepID=UPI00214DFB49|nr:complement C1q-like protein 2 [Epinephelus moara]
MKITATFLLLLLVVCSVSTGDVSKYQQPDLQDIHAVLREMTASLTKQRIETRLLQRQNEEQAAKLKELTTEVNELRPQLQEKQVAFSAALVSSGDVTIGPFPKHTVLIFKHVTTNIGNAYNPHTGIFTAPVRGAYHFVWYVGVNGATNHAAAAELVKNSEHINLAWEQQTNHYGTGSNGVDLLLEVGDVVFVRLWANTKVSDNWFHHVTFTGHLIFTM